MASQLVTLALAVLFLAVVVQSAPQIYPGGIYPQPGVIYPQPGVIYPPVSGGIYPGGVYPGGGIYPYPMRVYPVIGGSILGNLARAGASTLANVVGTAAAILPY